MRQRVCMLSGTHPSAMESKRPCETRPRAETNDPSPSPSYPVRPVGWVHSPLERTDDAPKQGFEGAPQARIEIQPEFRGGLDGLAAGQKLLILTWLHQADREVLAVHPRDDRRNPLTGVFATRSADRPNPIGVHLVTLLAIESGGVLL